MSSRWIPVTLTPMDEADLRLHLAKQTKLPVELIDLTMLDGTYGEVRSKLKERANRSPSAILFDVLEEPRLETTGRLFWEEATRGDGMFAIGSFGIEYALTAHWSREGLLPLEPPVWKHSGAVDRLTIVSSCCSPVTESQRKWALANGYACIQVSAWNWLDPHEAERSNRELFQRAVQTLHNGQSVILYTDVGPQDPSIARNREALRLHGMAVTDSCRFIGSQLDRLTKEILNETDLMSILIAGGDTSGYVTRELGIYTISCLATLVPGGPLCRCYSEEPRIDGLELSIKGGQVGGADYFELVRRGGKP